MTTQEIRQLAERKLAEHSLTGWKIRFESSHSRCGLCDYRNRTIRFSLTDHSEREVLDTILHEIAHALTPGHSHDRVWQQKLVEIGGNPNQFLSHNEFIERYLQI